MSIQTGTILDTITQRTREDLARRTAKRPLAQVEAEARRAPAPRDFLGALRAPGVSLIAEVKRASPSKGLLRPNFDPAELARTYAMHGATALSVLTNAPFFQGHLDHLRAAREAGRLPTLRKDFIIDPCQIFEARAAGADAVLLIVAVLEDAQLREFVALAQTLGMTALVEVHNAAELERALRAEPPLLGINNRDLHTFNVDLATTATLRPRVPDDVVLVAESGIHTLEDVARLHEVGVDAMLVGEALVTADDVGAQTQQLSAAGAIQPQRRAT
jgi:indole-3-glycerol phosphate synthase